MDDSKLKRIFPSDIELKDNNLLTAQCRVFKRWVSSQLKQAANDHEITEAVDIFRYPDILLSLTQELANRKALTTNLRPSDGISTQQNAITLIERLYGHDIATSVQMACDGYQHPDPANKEFFRLAMGLDALWILIVAAGAGTGPVEDVQASGTVRGSVGSSTSTLIGQRSKRSSMSSVLPDTDASSTRSPLLDRWLTRQDERLLAWCQDVTQSYEGVNVCNYTTAWRDGLALLAIINQQRPELFDYKSRLEKSATQNLGLAFHLITKEFAVARLLENEDLLSNDGIDARSVAVYLIELRSAVELDRRRRNKPAFEIRTSAMEQQGLPGDGEAGVTVTVATTSSRSSSPTASELTFFSEDASEPDEVSHMEENQLRMEDFQRQVERSLAWMLSMEERIGENFPELKEILSSGRVNDQTVSRDAAAEDESADLTALENSPLDQVKPLNERIVQRMSKARTQFNTHEDLNAHLTKHESNVRRCLRYGQRLANLAERVQRTSNMTPSSTTGDDSDNDGPLLEHLQNVKPSEVMKMLSILHERWTNLNKVAELGNRCLASFLLNRQETLLRAVEIQLNKLEWEKERQSTERFGATVEELKLQLSANRRLENYIEYGETLAQHMQDIVILVPSEAPDARNADFEGRIASLATHWTRLVAWVHTHYAQLQNALLHWRHFEEEADVLEEWLFQLRQEARVVESRTTRQMEQNMRRRNAPQTEEEVTREARVISEAVTEAVTACLCRYETRWSQLLASLDRRARAVREACGDSIEIQRSVESRVDALVSRWSQLTEPHLDWEDEEGAPSPNLASPISTAYSPRISPANMQQQNTPVQMREEHTKRSATNEPNAVPEKRVSLESGRLSLQPTGYRAEFEKRAEKVLNWLDSRIEALEIVTMKDGDKRQQQQQKELPLNQETLGDVIAGVDKELPDVKEDMVVINSLGQRYRKDLLQSGENVDELDQLFDDIEERWGLLDQYYSKATSLAAAEVVPMTQTSATEGAPQDEFPSNICESSKTFRQWLATAKAKATSPIYCEDGDQIDEVIANFTNAVQKQPRTANVEEFLSTLPSQEAAELRAEWQEVRRLINERVPVLRTLCENHDLFINQVERFEKLMSDMFDYLESVAQADNSQAAAVEAQLGESVEALRDMQKMQPTLSHLDGIVGELQAFFGENYIKESRDRLDKLKKTWNQVKDLTNDNITFLQERLEAAKKAAEDENKSMEDQPTDSATSYHSTVQEEPISVVRATEKAAAPVTVRMVDVAEMQKWISKAKHRLSKYATIHSREEMEAFGAFLQEFKAELDSKKPLIEAIKNGEATDTTGKPVSSRDVLLFSGHFTDLESEYAAGQERLKSATYHINDFNSLMSYEKNWLERADSLLQKSKTHVYMDTDEVCEDIAAFENLKAEHSEEDFIRLKLTAERLSSERIMSQKIATEFDSYAAEVASALKKLIHRLEELKKLKQQGEKAQATLDEYDRWMRDNSNRMKQLMREGGTAGSHGQEFRNWCEHVTQMDEVLEKTIADIPKNSTGDSALSSVAPEYLKERINAIKLESAKFKRGLLLFTYPSEIQGCILRCREATREHDAAAVNLEVVSLTSEHIEGLQKKIDGLVRRIRETRELIRRIQSETRSPSPPPELSKAREDLEEELTELYQKNSKILDYAEKFREEVAALRPYAERYSSITDPLDQVMMNIEEVTDYLETADTNNSHIELLQRILTELGEVLGREDRELPQEMKSLPESDKSTVQKLEDLLAEIEAKIPPIEGLNSTIADSRRVIDKAFAARNAIRSQLNGLVVESNDSSVTEATEIRVQPQRNSSISEKALRTSTESKQTDLQNESQRRVFNVVDSRANQLTGEMASFFDDLADFQRYCINIDQSENSTGNGVQIEPLQTSIAKNRKKLEVYLNFYEQYFKLQSQYLESRLVDLQKSSESLPQQDREVVDKVKKFWNDSRSRLAWQLEQFSQLSRCLKDADDAVSKYEQYPTDDGHQECLIRITQLEEAYKWKLDQDRARLEEGRHGEIARQLNASTKESNFLEKLAPFRDCLQQLFARLNEIQDELRSCQSIRTHELASQIQTLDQYFIHAQEASTKASSALGYCKYEQVPRYADDDGFGGESELQSIIVWLEAVLDTQKGRLNSYCTEFHLCRPYWQEYSNLWQSFMSEAVRLKHQIEMLQVGRLPTDDQASPEMNTGSRRDYAVNLCSSILTLQRLGSKIVWKAQNGPIAHGLDADLYLDAVSDKKNSRRPLRLESTFHVDIAFVNEMFDALVGDLGALAKQYSIEHFMPANLKIDANAIEEAKAGPNEDSLSESECVQETTFPQMQNQRMENIAVTDFEACLNRLKEELNWLQENNLFIPVVDTPTNYIAKLDGEFWLPFGAPAPVRLCSKWVKEKSQELAKLDAALKAHEHRSAQLCGISEKMSVSLGDADSQRQLHEAADELHACMEAARCMINRRRTRLSGWLSACTTIEAAMLMDADGEEIDKGGEQTLPVWIQTIRKRLDQSSANLDSPMFAKELEQLRSEFSPNGSGTGQTLRALEEVFENYLADTRSPLQSVPRKTTTPQLQPGVVESIEKSLNEWKRVCQLLKIEQTQPLMTQQAVPEKSVGSTTESNLEDSIRKLAFWLDSVSAYLESTVACLGGDFNQDAVIAHIKSRPGSSSTYTVRSLYPAVIQIQLQQYAIELEARKPQLDKLVIETDRLREELQASNQESADRLSLMIDEVRQCWNATSAQVTARLNELEKMMSATEELKVLERELDRWLSRAEADLASANASSQDPVERKRIIQDIIDRLPLGETKFTMHQNKCESILSTFTKEDTQKFRADQKASQMRWSQLVARLRESLDGSSQFESDVIETPVTASSVPQETELQRIVRLRSGVSKTPAVYSSNEQFMPVESRSMESSMIEAHPAAMLGAEPTSSTLGRHGFAQKPQLSESYQGNQLSQSTDIRSRPYDSRLSPRMPVENWPIFLAQLRQINDWLAHQDASFHQLRSTVGGDSESVSQLINNFAILEEEMRHQSYQVEDLLLRGQAFMRDQFTDGKYAYPLESEADSDGSEYDPSKGDLDESSMSSKRIARRIRRHLNHLDKHWTELHRSMTTFRQQLDKAFQKLTVFESVLGDAERELDSAQKLLMSQDPSYPTDDQTLQVIWDTCASVTHAIAGLDGQALCLSDDGTIISHVLISRLDGLKIGLERLRSEATEGMNPTSSGSPALAPAYQRSLRSPPQHMLAAERPDSIVSANAPIPRPKSPSECWLQAFKTVTYPWERCLLPSGNQVPYYKNHATQETQWDHPLMLELLQRMDESNMIRFPAYRAAAKIRQLQMCLFFDQIPLNVVTETFARQGLSSPLCIEGCDGRVMDVSQIVTCLTTLYCRVWDILASRDGVIKIKDANAGPMTNTPTQDTPTAAETNRQQVSNAENDSGQGNRPKSKKSPIHRSAMNCMTGVLCASGNKHNRGDDDSEDALVSSNSKRPLQAPSTAVENRPAEEKPLPSANVGPQLEPSTHSRVEKLQTRLQLPDGRKFDLPTCVDLALNLLLNSFDSARNGTVRVLSFKVTIFLLINTSLDEKYQYLFSLVADRDNKINNSRLWLLVYEIMQLPRQLGEIQALNSANSSLDPNILMCFKKNLKTKGHEHRSSSLGGAPSLESQNSISLPTDESDLLPSVGLDRFYEWLKMEPSIVAWLPALHRLIAGEKLVHQVRCAVCQNCPIRGLRYRCLRCLNFDLCQNCFLIGRVEKSHKITHPIQEYTNTLQRSDSLRDFSRVVRNRFKSKENFRQSSLTSENGSRITPTTAAIKALSRPPRASGAIRKSSTTLQNTSPSSAGWQINRPSSLGGDTRRRLPPSGPMLPGAVDGSIARTNAAKPRRGGSVDQEHELIAQYSQSLRRQNSLTTVGAPMYNSRLKGSANPPGAHWQFGSTAGMASGGGVYDRSRPLEPRFFTLRPGQMRGNGSGFRASSQPPPYPEPHVYVTGPPINTQAKWYRNPPTGYTGPVNAGSAGSLDKVLVNLEEENRFLRAEYDRLRMQSPSQNARPMRSPSLQYPLNQSGVYPESADHHGGFPALMYNSVHGSPYFPPTTPRMGYGQGVPQVARSQIGQSNNGILYGGSLGRGSSAAAYSAYLRGGGSRGMTFDPMGQRYQPKATFASFQQMPTTPTNQESDIAQETRLLRQHKTRLESRMQLLEDHNKALEDQLNRLRVYLNLPPSATATTPTSMHETQQTLTRANGSATPQNRSGYNGSKYPPVSNDSSPVSPSANSNTPVGFLQGQNHPQSVTGNLPR